MISFILIEEGLAFVTTNYSKLVALVALAEQQFPAGSQGAAKLQYVHDKLMAVQSFAENAAGLWPIVTESINLIVDMLPKSATTAAVTSAVQAVTSVVTPVAPVAPVSSI